MAKQLTLFECFSSSNHDSDDVNVLNVGLDVDPVIEEFDPVTEDIDVDPVTEDVDPVMEDVDRDHSSDDSDHDLEVDNEEDNQSGQFDVGEDSRSLMRLEPPIVTSNTISDISSGVSQSPVQPQLRSFPVSYFGSKPRCFSANWYKKYTWLEYSVQKDAIFCYACRFFSLPGNSRAEEILRSSGYRDWKHATGKNGALEKHDKCHSHRQAMISWSDVIHNSKKGTSVAQRLDSSRSILIEENKHYMKTIVQVILLCSRQNIPLRGHDESESSMNRGNFIEILKTIATHDSIIHARLTSIRNSVYTSPAIQNLIINILGDILRKTICENVKNSVFYSVLVDECKDSSKKEQLSFVIRYVDDSGNVQENFLTFIEAVCQNAESLSHYILETLSKYGLDHQKIVSQGYDGASVMSGKYSGVQQRIKAIVPHAIYIHCYAHTLNLVLVDAVKSVKLAMEFFVLLESLYVFFSTSKANSVFMEHQQKLYPHKQPMRLQRLSDTRWACRFSSINVVCFRFDCLLASLEEIAHGSDPSKAIEARGLYQQIKSFSFLITLIVFDKILTSTKGLSDQLQSDELDLAFAADLVVACQATIQHYRSDEMWEKIYKYATDISKLHDIETNINTHSRRKRVPRHLDDSVVYESVGSRSDSCSSHKFKQELYFPVIDAFLAELSRRFDKKNIEIMKAIQACHPHSEFFLSRSVLKPLIDTYNLDAGVDAEIEVATNLFTNKEETSQIKNVFIRLFPLRQAFPTLFKLIRIAMTIAVSTASCERSFSVLKRIKTYLRSTMGDQRLSDLGIISIEREFSQDIPTDRVVDEFMNRDKNRRIILS